MSKTADLGAHTILQDRAEKNAKVLIALWMTEGLIEPLAFPISKLPTQPIQDLADIVQDSLGRGRKGFAEIAEDNTDHVVALAEADGELSALLSNYAQPNIHTLKSELEAFHVVKSRQLLTWELQAAMDKGEDTVPILARLNKLEAEGAGTQTLLARAYALAFNPDVIPPPDETCMAIGDVPIAARGNLTAIQGKSKVGKSAVVSAVLGAAQRGEYYSEADTLCMDWKGKATGAIIHIDTEQSLGDWHALVNRSVLRSGHPAVSDRLVSLPLVMFARSERVDILRACMTKEQADKGGIDAVIIDGIADLCASPNDEEKALELVSQVHALSQQYACPIYCILHENPGTDQGKTRGHLGSELNRKAFANLRIDKDTETAVSTIFGTDMRKRDLPKEQGFCFAWDEVAGMHSFKGRAAGLKAAEKESKDIAAAREFWEPIFENASQRENQAVPALTSKEAAEIEREISGNEKTTKPDTMKKRMQKAEALGVLRKFDVLKWSLTTAGKAGNEREN